MVVEILLVAPTLRHLRLSPFCKMDERKMILAPVVDLRIAQNGGISVFAIDPGETCGWAWCCLAWKELFNGITLKSAPEFLIRDSTQIIGESLNRARSHRSGIELNDSRFRCGELGRDYTQLSTHDPYGSVPKNERERKKKTDSIIRSWKKHHTSAMLTSEAAQCSELFAIMNVFRGMAERTSRGKVRAHTAIVIEDFILRQHTQDRSLLSPVRVTSGIVTLLSNAVILSAPVFIQSGSDAMNIWTDERLKDYELYLPGRPHANDAVRHMALWITKFMSDVERAVRK